jgi:NADPH:quinone reductase-like Zn-dependent oxidoreductase
VDHSQNLPGQVDALGVGAPGFVFLATHAAHYLPIAAELVAPQGRVAVIDDPETLNVMPLKGKSASLHWEMMFTRSNLQTADMGEQGKLLDEVGRLIDAGTLRTTVGEHFGAINATNLRRAHALLESGKARGKIVLEGFSN